MTRQITDAQIKSLLDEARQATDWLQVAICTVALGKALESQTPERDAWVASQWTASEYGDHLIDGCRDECARVIEQA